MGLCKFRLCLPLFLRAGADCVSALVRSVRDCQGSLQANTQHWPRLSLRALLQALL